jgi:prevent-host-death family protein
MWSSNALHLSLEISIPRIGLRELKTHASEVLRQVKEKRARYVITNRGEPVAVIVPYAPAEERERLTPDQAWALFLELRDKTSAANTEPFSAVELLHEMRRG